MSKAAIAAKRKAKLEVLCLPKLSLDLDLAVWCEVEHHLRAQERRWPEGKKETRAEFECRLDRLAKALPSSFIDKSIGDLKRRCERLYLAKGGLFEEGGKGE